MINRPELVRDVERLAKHRGVRSADRANMATMLKRMRGGHELSYQEQVNLWAYLNRYRTYLTPADRSR